MYIYIYIYIYIRRLIICVMCKSGIYLSYGETYRESLYNVRSYPVL